MHMISALLVLSGVLLSSRPRGKKSKQHGQGDDDEDDEGGGESYGSDDGDEEEDKFGENIDDIMHNNDCKDNSNDSVHIMRFSPPCSPRKVNGSGLDTSSSSSSFIARVPSEQLSMAITSRTISDQVILSSRVLSL